MTSKILRVLSKWKRFLAWNEEPLLPKVMVPALANLTWKMACMHRLWHFSADSAFRLMAFAPPHKQISHTTIYPTIVPMLTINSPRLASSRSWPSLRVSYEGINRWHENLQRTIIRFWQRGPARHHAKYSNLNLNSVLWPPLWPSRETNANLI